MKKHLESIYTGRHDLSPTSFLLLQFLAVFLDDKNVLSVPTVWLLKVLPISKSSLWRGLKILENKGFISYKRSNTYLTVNWVYKTVNNANKHYLLEVNK